MNDAYAQGFITKCAEAGVDPEALVKTSARGDQMLKLIRSTKRIGGDVNYTRDALKNAIRSDRSVLTTRGLNPWGSSEGASAPLTSLIKTLRWQAENARMYVKDDGGLYGIPSLGMRKKRWNKKPALLKDLDKL